MFLDSCTLIAPTIIAMRTGRGLLIVIAMAALMVLSIPTSNLAFAAEDPDLFKWKLSGTLNTSSQVKAGDSISYTYVLTNTGNATKFINTPILIFPPPQFTTTELNTSGFFTCDVDNILLSEDVGGGSYMVGREKIFCAPSGDDNPEYIYLDPGQTYSYQILGIANSNYTINSRSYSMSIYSSTQEQMDAFQNGINIWETSPSDAIMVTNYPYGEFLAQQNQSNNENQNDTTTSTPKVLGQTQDPNKGKSGGTDTGSAANAEAIGDTSKNEVAASDKSNPANTRNPNLKNPNNNNDISWADLIRENQKLIATASSITIVILLIGSIFTRKIRAKRRAQNEYKKAVTKLRNTKKETEKTFAPDIADTNDTKPSITRTKIIVTDPVELDSTIK